MPDEQTDKENFGEAWIEDMMDFDSRYIATMLAAALKELEHIKKQRDALEIVVAKLKDELEVIASGKASCVEGCSPKCSDVALDAIGITPDTSEVEELLKENVRLKDAIRWALGENGEFLARGHEQGAYWWRKELRARAAIDSAKEGKLNS